MNWTKFPKQPNESGHYLVGHAGTQMVIHYLHYSDDKIPQGNVKVGWQKDPKAFGATQWMKIDFPDESIEFNGRRQKDFKVNDSIRVTVNCLVSNFLCEYPKFHVNYKPYVSLSKGAVGIITHIESGYNKWIVRAIFEGVGEVEFNNFIGYNFEYFSHKVKQ